MRTDARMTDMTKLVIAFRNFAIARKNGRNLVAFQKRERSSCNRRVLDGKVLCHFFSIPWVKIHFII